MIDDTENALKSPSQGIIENSPYKRAKEMHNSTHRGSRSNLDTSGISGVSSKLPPGLPTGNSVPESECMKIQVDLIEQRAHLVSPKPVRIKL